MIHKEGYKIIGITILVLLLFNLLVKWFIPSLPVIDFLAGTTTSVLLVLVLQFFRNPKREIPQPDDTLIYAPADGKVVAIEEVEEPEFFKDKRIQVSIFMSITNVHVNRLPVSGDVQYVKYHPGKYLVAWHPKSSTENERTTVVIGKDKKQVLIRQIAGAVAKRIVNYLQEGQQIQQGNDFGFIKFGSRVDILLPLDADIQVSLQQKVKGNKTIIAKW